MDKLLKTASKNLKRIRETNNYSQEQLAEELGVEVNLISKIENGDISISSDILSKVTKLFNLNTAELFQTDISQEEIIDFKESLESLGKKLN